MTIRRKCSIKPEHQVVLSEFVGKAYTPNPDGTWTFQEGAADAMLAQPAFGQVLRNLAGALNEGELYDDAPPPPIDVYPWPEGYSLNPDPLPHGVPSNLNVTWKPGVVEWYLTDRVGRASCSVHGGGYMTWCGVSDERGVLRPEPMTQRGQGGTPHILTPRGYFVMMWCETDQARAGYYNFQDPA